MEKVKCEDCQFVRQTLDTDETLKVKLVTRCSLGNNPETCTEGQPVVRRLFGL